MFLGASENFGKSFEHFIFMELKAFQSYSKNLPELFFWRSTSQFEVDFLLGDKIAIEVKLTRKVKESSAKGLLALAEEEKHDTLIVVSLDPLTRVKNGVHYMYWKDFLTKLWSQVSSDELRF